MTEPPLSPHDEARLRDLLEGAVSDVEPRHGLDAIRNRTKVSPMSARRPWILGAAAAVLATAATITVVNLAGSNGPSATGPAPGPAASGAAATKAAAPSDAGSASAGASPSAGPSGGFVSSAAVPVYYVGDTSHGPRLFREFRKVTTDDPLSAALSAAVGEGANGGSATPTDPDYRTGWPALTSASGTVDGDTITVSLGGDSQDSLADRPSGMSEDEAKLAVQQLVYTAQAATQSTAPVRFELYGKPADTVLGVPTADPVTRADATQVLAQVWIIDPAQGASLKSGFEVSGLAAAFEANVQWELKQGDTVVKKGFTTARECCTMAPYSFTVDVPPGDYTLVVHDEDASGGEGPAPWQDTKDVTVTP